MEEYIFILEQLEKFQIEDKLLKLSKKYTDKKVVLFGANNALEAISSKYDLKKYFNVTGICDENLLKENIFQVNGFKVISLQNLYFSGVDVVINLKDEFFTLERNLRKNHLIKKRVKVEHLLEKSLFKKLSEFYNKVKISIQTYKLVKKTIPVFRNFFSDNVEELNTKFNYEKKLYELVNNQDKPVRVLFIIQDYKQWTLQGLYNLMKDDEQFKVLPVVALPNSLKSDIKTDNETIEYFNALGIECIDGYEYETKDAVMLKALKPDMIFYQQPELLQTGYSTHKLSGTALTCFVENEFAPDAQESYKSNFISDRLNNSWKLFISHNLNLKSKNAVDCGFTRFEYYKTEIKNEYESLWSKSENILKNRIVYMPSYSLNEKFNIFKFREQMNKIFEFAQNHPQYSFVVVADKELKSKCIEKKIFTQDEFNGYFSRWEELPNALVRQYNEAVEIFKTSDILITDSIKNAVLYFPSTKPVIYLENNNKLSLNETCEKIYKTFYKSNSNEAVEIILEDLLINDNDYNAQDRNMLLSRYSRYLTKDSSQIIINYIKTALSRDNSNN